MKTHLNKNVEGRRPKAEGQRRVPRSTLDARRSTARSGIALVITLILLSVTLVMAIAFLAISRRERNSVTTTTDAATAKLAADSALAHAEAQIVANVFATTNPYNFGLLVSTNFINTNGFVAAGGANPTNVSYTYNNGAPLSAADNLQNLANLLYGPRSPVFIVTNAQTGASDFRFYLDLNRNGKFEDTRIDAPSVDSTGFTNSTLPEVGDPQWIGQLTRPDAPHGPNNYFVARYAFFAAPAGNALDLNYIHNQTKTETVNPNPTNSVSDGFFRNQGVGSWEINLAAFLTDLNTNEWDTTFAPYNYLEPNFVNNGFAFQDALSLLSYRYDYAYNSLASFQNLYGVNAYLAYANGFVDSYTAGNLMTNTQLPFLNVRPSGTPWAGADNTNHYFNLPSDLFDRSKISTPYPNFIDRLTNASAGVSTYDRYTFYRLLA